MTENLIAKASIVINTPTSKVWEALTNHELIKKYLFGSEVFTDWKEGSPIIYKGNYQGKAFEDKGNVVTVEPEKLLVATHWSPSSGTPDAPESYHTVTYTLHPTGESTEITITQDLCASEDERNQNEQFWTIVLQGMKKLLEDK